jgi:HAE1 family hydrophobic/amphiphilic exporter-1
VFATFVRRPVLAAVIAILITILGVLALVHMPMTLYPEIAPPEVNVTVHYTGANAETVIKAAIVPLERAINGVPHMKYMSSDATNDGMGVVQVLFEAGTDPDVAAINVQNRVNTVIDELPPEVIKSGVEVAKEQHAMLMYLDIYSTNPQHTEPLLYNFADINVLAELKRIEGVGRVSLEGSKEYAMRIWLDPTKLDAYDVSVDEVLAALRSYNVEAAPGAVGENSDRAATPLQYTLRYPGKFTDPADYAHIPLRATTDGRLLRIGDVATVELGTVSFDVEAKLDEHPSASIEIKQAPGSNAREVIAAVKAKLAEIKARTFLAGMNYEISFDVSRFLDASVHEVLRTLVEAFLLVTLVVFIFLQDARTTLVPILAVPVSLIGSLIVTDALGFSLNLITLFALVLAIGIVVDNAIVMVEAVHHKITHDRLDPRDASERAVAELGPAIVAMTLVMAAVFVPLAFIPGPAGVFYRQFGLATAVAIVLSGFVALTLTPALCGALLRPGDGTPRRWARLFNRGYERVESGYVGIARISASRLVVPILLIAGFIVGAVLFGARLPRGFIPDEDQGTFYASVTTPAGATLERTKAVVDEIAVAARGLPGVESVSTLAGANIMTDGTGASYGAALVNLEPWDERSVGVDDVIRELRRRTANITGANIEFFGPPAVPGYGNSGGFELRLLDRTGNGDVQAMQRTVDQFLADLRARPEIGSAFTMFDARYPQYLVRIDMDRAARMGVTTERALATLQTLLGSRYATNFIRFGQLYKVMVQAPPEYRAKPEQILTLRVRNDRGDLVPLSAFMALDKSQGPDALTRYNMYPSAEISGDAAAGVSSATLLAAVQELARAKLPRGFTIEWAGVSRDEVEAGNEGLIVAGLALLFVWLVLAAQYESFVLPAAVILALPPGVFGAFGLLHLMGLDNNIYTQISLVVLIGLLGKNAILIVEYAELAVARGMSARNAVVEAARLRLRPIVMTSLAFVAGLLPLMFASGAGAIGNRTIGTATLGGMIIGTVFGLVVVPGAYVACKWVSRR